MFYTLSGSQVARSPATRRGNGTLRSGLHSSVGPAVLSYGLLFVLRSLSGEILAGLFLIFLRRLGAASDARIQHREDDDHEP